MVSICLFGGSCLSTEWMFVWVSASDQNKQMHQQLETRLSCLSCNPISGVCHIILPHTEKAALTWITLKTRPFTKSGRKIFHFLINHDRKTVTGASESVGIGRKWVIFWARKQRRKGQACSCNKMPLRTPKISWELSKCHSVSSEDTLLTT